MKSPCRHKGLTLMRLVHISDYDISIMTEILPQIDELELGFCTRSDGVSGMSVTALADFCGTQQHTITELLNRLRDSDPIVNDLPKSLKPFAGKEQRLIVNDDQNSVPG